MNFYIAFSIHGTNAFIRASKTTSDYEIQEKGIVVEGTHYQMVRSRHPAASKDQTKLHYPLLNNKDGKPTNSLENNSKRISHVCSVYYYV